MDNIKQWEGWCIGLNRREFLIEGIGRLCLLNYMSLRVDTNIRYNFFVVWEPTSVRDYQNNICVEMRAITLLCCVQALLFSYIN